MSAAEDLKIEKLKLEIEELRRNTSLVRRITSLSTVLIAVAGLSFGAYQYFQDKHEARLMQQEAAKKEQRLRERELFRPLWEQQITTYMDAINTVSTIATTNDTTERNNAIKRFWLLYQGPLIIYENKGVSGAMVTFGNCLTGEDACNADELQKRSRALATQIQLSLSESWNQGLGNFAAGKFHYQ